METQRVDALVDELAYAGTRRDEALQALIALGPAARPALLALVRDGVGEAAAYAAGALRFLAGPADDETAAALMAAVRSSRGDARAPFIEVLGALRVAPALPLLVDALSDRNFVCVSAALALGRLGNARAVEPLAAVLADGAKFWVPRGAAAVALGELGALATAALPSLRAALEYRVGAGETWDERAREAVVDALARIELPGTASTLPGNGSRYEMWGIY